MAVESRLFAIGDIHGCYAELATLINYINPTRNDTLVFLADYVDRGPESKRVLDFVMKLRNNCKVIALKGNHEDMMQRAFLESDTKERKRWMECWLLNGGIQTLTSYGLDSSVLDGSNCEPSLELKKHLNFINSMPKYHITDTHIFVHATPRPDVAIQDQEVSDLLWRRANDLDSKYNYNHISGKTIVSGHTAQVNGKPLKLSSRNIIIDSGCFHTGILTAVNINDDVFIQSNSKSSWIL